MKGLLIGCFCLLNTFTPAMADPVSDGHFVTGVNVCLNFGNDAWFVQDRIEGAGWLPRDDADYGIMIYASPDGTVLLIPPAEDGDYPVWCSVVSGDVGLGFAEDAVRAVLVKSGISAISETQDGCQAFRSEQDQTIRVFNDGNEDMCNQPDSARVDVVWDTNPVANQ